MHDGIRRLTAQDGMIVVMMLNSQPTRSTHLFHFIRLTIGMEPYLKETIPKAQMSLQ
jgi:hypothetical protein